MSDHAADVTLVEVLADLRSQGFRGVFRVAGDGSVGCRACGLSQPASQLEVAGFRRLEGASDPGDMALVLAVACRRCDERGAIVLRYGPEAGPADAELLASLTLPAGVVVPPRDRSP